MSNRQIFLASVYYLANAGEQLTLEDPDIETKWQTWEEFSLPVKIFVYLAGLLSFFLTTKFFAPNLITNSSADPSNPITVPEAEDELPEVFKDFINNLDL